MKKARNYLGILLLALVSMGCDNCNLFENVEPDLRFKTNEWIYNPCQNINEFLDTRNLYYTNIIGTNQLVLLYWRPNTGGFFDCNGYPWYISPQGTVLYSYRYMVNEPAPTGITDAAEEPAAQSYTEVIDPDGNSSTTDGPVVSFGRMAAGQVVELISQVIVTQYGVYQNKYEADPVNRVAERIEDNNIFFDNSFESARLAQPVSFAVNAYDRNALIASGEPAGIIDGTNIELINYPGDLMDISTDKPGRVIPDREE